MIPRDAMLARSAASVAGSTSLPGHQGRSCTASIAMRSTRDSDVGASQRAMGPDSGGPFTGGAARSPTSDTGGHLIPRNLAGELAVSGRRFG